MKQSLLSTIRLRHFTLCFLTLLMTFSLIAQEEETPVFKAVKANNLKEVKRLVESGADFQTGDMWHVEPVELAVSNYYKDIALYLLQKGATGRNGFYDACEKNDLSWIEILRDYGFTDSEAVLAASEYGHLNVVKFLVQEGFSVNVSKNGNRDCFVNITFRPLRQL